ncbi:MAG: hypothetical protein GY704_12180, partial [Phycisphaeraceae bacterium]|nr:hypothetical protein [Phycisphaeraceae bacterium]
DCIVEGADLGLFLSSRNTADAPTDYDGDGIVSGSDLGRLLAAFGL